jgi:branched-chain amino acid transport system permease protein
VCNFAFANTLVLGGFVAVTTTALGFPLPLTLLIAVIVCAVVSGLVERVAIRFMPLGSHAELITTLGAATALTALTAIVWGAGPQRLVPFPETPLTIAGAGVLPISLILIALPIIFGIAMHFLLSRTRFGLTSRAQAFDREATMLRGVNVRWLSLAAFAVAGIFAGIAGPFVMIETSSTPYIAITLALKGFVALALGGLGSQLGAVIAGFVIGLIEAAVALYVGPFVGDFAVFLVFVLVLVFRSQGLFGSRNLRLV